jgi:hypothetical protein
MTHRRLEPRQVLHGCDPAAFALETTAELDDLNEIVGHRRAVGAVDFGIAIRARGFKPLRDRAGGDRQAHPHPPVPHCSRRRRTRARWRAG